MRLRCEVRLKRAIFTIAHSLRVIAAISVTAARRHPQPNVCATHFSTYRSGACGHCLQAQPMQRAHGTHNTSDACGRRRGKPRCTRRREDRLRTDLWRGTSWRDLCMWRRDAGGRGLPTAAQAGGMPTAGGGHMASEPLGSSAQHGSLGGVKADAGMPEAL
jgi:hypothetical protein